MAKGTTFGNLHSNTDLSLIQLSVDIQPATPKTKFVEIPGADGSKDLTDALGVGVRYGDRTITWEFALYPGADWALKQRQISGVLNGIKCNITIDDDPSYYYSGRVIVEKFEADNQLRKITVKAVCRPWKLKQAITTVTRDDLSESYKFLNLTNDRMPVVPLIAVTAETTLKFGESIFTVGVGEHKLLDIVLPEGESVLKAKVDSGAGSITVSYQEGAL